jgi:ammonia channel protein AmtB
MRRAGGWALLVVLGVTLGLGVAWLESALAIPKNVVAWFWIVLLAGTLGFAAWTAWGYYRAIRDENELE